MSGLAEAVRAYLEAQDALANWEYESINRDDWHVVKRRRDDARRDLDTELAKEQP